MKRTAWLLALALFLPPALAEPGTAIVEASRSQIGKTLSYDPEYRTLDYQGGDPPIEAGVCTDVVIRALRAALDLDLQKFVHEDMAENFSRYPRNWRLRGPDRHIDHRRVPNLRTFFKRQGFEIPLTRAPEAFLPGDVVTCIVPPHLPHIMVVSDRRNVDGVPLIIHNIGAGAREEDRLFEFELTGHYRVRVAEGAE